MAGNRVWRPDGIKLTKYNEGVTRSRALLSVNRAADQLVGYIHDELAAVGRVDTGELRDSYTWTSHLTAYGAEAEVFSSLPPLPSGRELADIVNRGSGIYGPYGVPITPTTARVLRFNPGARNSGSAVTGVGRRRTTSSFGRAGQFTGKVYSPSVVGQRPTYFLDRAIARIKATDFGLL